MSHPLFDKHRARSIARVTAIAERGYWTPFPESASPKVYGEGAADTGKAAFDKLLNRRFPIMQPASLPVAPSAPRMASRSASRIRSPTSTD